MKELPILFTGEMVQAVLDGRKTHTRRVMKPQPNPSTQYVLNSGDGWFPVIDGYMCGEYPIETRRRCPYGIPGDRLWVREKFSYNGWDDFLEKRKNKILYAATHEGQCPRKWKPSIHMPKWASRIVLEVLNIRVERVKDITWRDIWKEGVTIGVHPDCQEDEFGKRNDADLDRARCFNQFQRLWDSINLKRGFGWHMNPWVWVVEFKKLEEVE